MILNQSIDGVLGQLECDFILRDHVNMDNVGFNLQHLVVEHGLNQGVGVSPQLGLWSLGEHDRAQGPYGVG